jgi:hypothetical protein
MQARARGMLTRKHDAEELAQLSTVTKAEARAERRAALGKSLDDDAQDGQRTAPDGYGENGEGEFEEEALEEDEGAGARGNSNLDAATHGIVKMQARARGMLTRKHDAEELAQLSTVTKAEARAERRAALGRPSVLFSQKDLSHDSHVVSLSNRIVEAGDLRHPKTTYLNSVGSNRHEVVGKPLISSGQLSSQKATSGILLSKSHSSDYEELEGSQRSPELSATRPGHLDSTNSNSDQSISGHKKQSQSSVSFSSPRSLPGIVAPPSFSYNASAAPGDPVSQALLKKLFAIEQSVSLLQAQIVKCLTSDDASVYDQLHNSNSQVEKLMLIRSEILKALQHQQQMAATSPKVTGVSSSHITPHKANSLSPLGHSSKAKISPTPLEYSYMSDNASSATFSASSRTNGDMSSSVSHSAVSSSEDMYYPRTSSFSLVRQMLKF